MATTPVTLAAEPHVYLNGRPPFTEFLGYMKGQTIEGQTGGPALDRALADAWRDANDHILAIEANEAGLADDAAVGTLPDELVPLREQVLADPIVQRSFAFLPIEIGLVELDRLVVYQKHINLAHVERLRARLMAASDPRDLFVFCLPFEDRNDPPPQVGQIGQMAWAFKAPSNDFRVLNAQVVDAAAMPGLHVGGAPTHLVVVALGYGANYLNAIEIEGRLVLSNGSHRAYALREAGHKHVPCLVQKASRRDELAVVVGPEHVLVQEPERFLTAARPPLLKDYFDEKLRMNVTVPRNVRQVQLGVNTSIADLPG